MDNYNEIDNIPEAYKPLTMWQYFGYQLLYAVPMIGLVFLIIHSLGGTTNQNLKNFARSYFCMWIVIIVVLTVIISTSGIAAFFSVF